MENRKQFLTRIGIASEKEFFVVNNSLLIFEYSDAIYEKEISIIDFCCTEFVCETNNSETCDISNCENCFVRIRYIDLIDDADIPICKDIERILIDKIVKP